MYVCDDNARYQPCQRPGWPIETPLTRSRLPPRQSISSKTSASSSHFLQNVLLCIQDVRGQERSPAALRVSADMQSDLPTTNGLARTPSHSNAVSAPMRLPLARLLQLVMILQSERYPNVRRLAEACGVSRRTIYRDLTVLETAGLSLVYLPERQGYVLGRECVLQPPQLEDREALAILIMSRLGSIPDPFGSLLAGTKGPFQGHSRPSAGPP